MNDPMAFQIIDYVLKEESSFDLMDNEWFVDTLDTKYLDGDGRGLLIVEKTKITKAINKAKKEKNEDDREMYLQVLNRVLSDFGDKDFVIYWCK